MTQQQSGTKPCISETGTGGHCIDGVGFEDVQSVAVSPDGNNAYAAAPSSNAVTILDRDDGKLDGKASAAKTQKQKGKKIIVKVKVKAGENLEAVAKGKVTVKKKSYKLKKTKKSVAANESATLKLKPDESKDAKKIAKALKKSKGKAKLDVTLSDVAANTSESKLSVKLKG